MTDQIVYVVAGVMTVAHLVLALFARDADRESRCLLWAMVGFLTAILINLK